MESINGFYCLLKRWISSLADSGGCPTQAGPMCQLWMTCSQFGGWLSAMACTRGTLTWLIMTVRRRCSTLPLIVGYMKHQQMLACCFSTSVYYASGCSIARFPEDGIVLAKNLKDQGTFLHCWSHSALKKCQNNSKKFGFLVLFKVWKCWSRKQQWLRESPSLDCTKHPQRGEVALLCMVTPIV